MKYPNIKVKLTGKDGNAFAILGRVIAALRKAKVNDSEIAEYRKAAMSGDYNHLLATTMGWVNVT